MSGDINLKELNILINDILKFEDFKFFNLSMEKISEILKYLQYLLIKIRFENDRKEIDLNKSKSVKEFSDKLILLENYFYYAWKGSAKNEESFYIYFYSIIATLFDYIGSILSDKEFKIKAAVLYCISEYESNSTIIINNLLEKDGDFNRLVNFDYKTNNFEIISELDLIIFLNILFFSRKFKSMQKMLERNQPYFIKLRDFSDWISFFNSILHFINTGKNGENVKLLFSKILNDKIKYENPTLIWIINRLEIHLKSFFQHSIWIIPNKLKNIPDKFIKILTNDEIYELWKSQRNCIDSISKFGINNIFLMPTSSGKTLIAELQTIYHISNKRKKVLYICPTNTLVYQIYYEHYLRFIKMGINSLRLTGSYDQTYIIDDFLIEKSSFIIMTPEKFDYVWRNKPEFLEYFSLIIFDEFQLIEDFKRGLKYELLISRVKQEINKRDLDLNLTFLSACIPHSAISPILKWLGSEKSFEINIRWKPTRNIEGIITEDLENKSKHGIVFPNLNRSIIDLFPMKKLKTVDDKLIFFIKYVLDFQPIMIFYENKPGCERIIKKIYELRKPLQLSKHSDPFFKLQLDLLRNELGHDSKLLKYIEYGLAFHHAGLPESIRDIVQILIKKSYIRIFACTTTFAEGVNFPVQLIMFHSLNLFDEELQQTHVMSFRLYENIIGRAGRALKYSEGLILIPDKDAIAFNYINQTLNPLKSVLNSLESELLEVDIEELLHNKLISDIQVDLLTTENINELNPEDYFKNTFFFNEKNFISIKIVKHLKKQKEYIKNFKYPTKSKPIFNGSGLNLLFCKELYDFIILNRYSSKINEYDINQFLLSNEFEEINKWIYTHHPEFLKLEEDYFEIINIWINRTDFNYKELYEYCRYDDKMFFKIISVLNSKIRYIFPWIWSLIMKILIIQNPELKRFKLLPSYIKYGLNSEKKFINYIYESLKDMMIEETPISKDLITNLVINYN